MQQDEITESSRTVLDYLSFEADQTIQEMTIPSTPIRHGSSSDTGSNGESRPVHMQGILWKRRDVFKNRWRPRWFVLHSDQCLLTYYLLANQESERVISGGSSSTPGRRRSALCNPQSSSISICSEMNSSRHTNDNQDSNRSLADSSPGTIDCDVVPRGTIYLLESTVEANEALTVPEEDLYALTITDHENGSHCHLAARTIEARDEWIQHIRTVCQSGVPDQSLRPPELNRVPYSPQTPMPGRRMETNTIVKNNTASIQNRQNKSHPSLVSQKTLDATNTKNKNSANDAGKGLLGERNSSRDMEVLVVFAPVILYKVLNMTSFSGLATLCFVLTSGLAMRWVLIQHLSRTVQLLDRQDGGERSLGDGSICCRLTEDVADICGKEGAASLPHILVSSLAKAICQQPRLASKKYKLIPPFFSTDVKFLDMNAKKSDELDGVWVIKASEMSLDEIADYFIDTNEQPQVGMLKRFSGPACEIVLTSDEEERDSRVHLELNLSRCPITVFVSCHNDQRKGQVANISIHFQSTDTTACREFVETFQKSILPTKVEKKGLW